MGKKPEKQLCLACGTRPADPRITGTVPLCSVCGQKVKNPRGVEFTKTKQGSTSSV